MSSAWHLMPRLVSGTCWDPCKLSECRAARRPAAIWDGRMGSGEVPGREQVGMCGWVNVARPTGLGCNQQAPGCFWRRTEFCSNREAKPLSPIGSAWARASAMWWLKMSWVPGRDAQQHDRGLSWPSTLPNLLHHKLRRLRKAQESGSSVNSGWFIHLIRPVAPGAVSGGRGEPGLRPRGH